MRRGAQAGGDVATGCGAAGGAAAGLAAVLGDAEAYDGEVEDLAALGSDHIRFAERGAAAGASPRGVSDDAVGAGGLPECRAVLAVLAADAAAGLLAETSGTRDFLPGRVE